MTHLKRCFDALKLPFSKLYIGCTTVPEGIRMAASETALHVLYMMSANFYDEDAEPMAVREVVENILRPFGLMMVQKDANVYIYDYNTVKRGLPMKRYDFSSWSYEAEETINFNHGNLPDDIGFMSTDSSYGFEQMINNVKITSSLYGEKDLAKYEVVESKLSDPFATGATDTYVETIYNKCDTWDAERFVLYKNKKSDSTLIGALLTYTGDQNVKNKMSFYAKNNYLIRTEGSYYINVLTKLYINTREDPFSEKMEEDARTRMAKLYCDLILCDSTGLPIMYYCNWYASPDSLNGWKAIENGVLQDNGKFVLKFSQESVERGRIANTWLANSIHEVDSKYMEYCVTEKNYQKGVSLPVPPASGYLKLDFINCIISDNALKMPGYPDVYPADKVRNLLINNVEISIKDADGKDISTDDYEFKSYVNKKVATDLADITLKCISANEEKAPVGKANMLRKVDNRYELQLSFTRSGQTDILERLLMCTIHSNFATKKEVFTVDIKMRENPALSFVSYSPILSDKYLISGCKLNFQRAVATLTAVGYSDDVARLSSIPYD